LSIELHFQIYLASSVCFFGKISPNFDLKNMISTYTEDFPWKKWPKFARFSNKKVSWLPYFDDKFQQVVKNINGFYFFPTFISSLSPNLAKSSYRWSPLQLHHKIEKTKTHACKQRRPILVRCTTVIWQKPSTEMRLGR
jgi:hypothetical protein